MKISHCLAFALVATPLLATTTHAAPQATASADAALLKLVQDFVEAQRQFDQTRLGELTAPDFIEISPVGEVDRRADFLAFYAADKKNAAPVMTVTDTIVRDYGNAASIIAKLSFKLPPAPDGATRSIAIRVSYLAIRSGNDWKLASAQYTPERPRAPAPPK